MTTLSFSDNVVRKEKNMNLETKARQRLAVIYKDDGKIKRSLGQNFPSAAKVSAGEEKRKEVNPER